MALRDDVLGAELGCERQAAGDVVVVDVGLQDVADGPAALRQDRQDTIDVALRVDHHGGAAGGHHVGAVPELGGGDDDDLWAGHCVTVLPALPISRGNPWFCQVTVPPATFTVWMPWLASHMTTWPERLPVRHTT